MEREALRTAYEALRREAPQLYLREAAQRLGVSEMTLLPIAHGEAAIPLRPEFPALFQRLPQLGPLMGLSRNEWAVIETTGPYPAPTFEDSVGLLTSPIIDLRLYLKHWAYAYAVNSFGKDGRPLYSFQFFTPWGEAIHKVYLRQPEYLPAWQAIVEEFRQPNGSLPPPTSPPPSDFPASEARIDREAFLDEWARLQDTHEFHGFLRRHRLSRLQAMRLAEGRFAWALPPSTVKALLHWARQSHTPIMFFVGNAGIHHIFTGSIRTLSEARGWINVLDEVFTLHLNPTGLAAVYLVEKPSTEGPIYSVELFGPKGEEILWIFGARKPGQLPPSAWVEYAKSLIQQAAYPSS
ncbi:MAG: hemin-degrading factor [Bacteroidia bacterium]|nr:hemin-degrading factor [Bacteroidia bacterium]MDW8088284.1 ChuX/HutX family heme-like substrate-binding protein [Bacteroidia bacterium]